MRESQRRNSLNITTPVLIIKREGLMSRSACKKILWEALKRNN